MHTCSRTQSGRTVHKVRRWRARLLLKRGDGPPPLEKGKVPGPVHGLPRQGQNSVHCTWAGRPGPPRQAKEEGPVQVLFSCCGPCTRPGKERTHLDPEGGELGALEEHMLQCLIPSAAHHKHL